MSSISLTPDRRRVARVIQRLAAGGPARITTRQIMAETGVCRRTAQYAVRELCELGAVTRFGESDRVLAVDHSHPLWAELRGVEA